MYNIVQYLCAKTIKEDRYMRTPILETERLVLRPLKIDDAETIFKNWTSDPEVAKFMRWNTHENVEVTKEWIKSEVDAIESDNVYNWGFVLKETGELIGSGGLIFKEDKVMYELGYNIMKKNWSQGLTTEAAKRIVEFGRNELRQEKMYCCHAKENPASGRVMEKAGFKYQNDAVYYSRDKTKVFDSRECIWEANA